MEWYLVKLVYKINYATLLKENTFDEQIRLIYAEDDLHAFQKARLIGHKEANSFQKESSALIEWKFVDVSELHPINIWVDGAEMFSIKLSCKNADEYIRETQKKALHLFDLAVSNF